MTSNRRAELAISILASLTTFAVSPLNTLDPVNLPKFWVLSCGAFGLLGLILNGWKNVIRNKNLLVAVLAFNFFAIVSTSISDAPLEQMIFGTYGRNTGLITYFCFSIVLIAAANFASASIKKTIVTSMVVTFSVNTFYGIIQLMDLDPFTWANPYTPIIGTLGNPNFMSALLGMGCGLAFAYMFAAHATLRIRIASLTYVLLACVNIWKSQSQQGFLLVALTFAICVYYFLKFGFKKRIVSLIYLAMCIIGGTGVILGMLQKGPFSGIIYKPSVTYRGDYWRAAIASIKDHPLFGLGPDSFGDWYRYYRTLEATTRRGPTAVSDAVHNVFLDIGSTTGLLSMLAYLFIIAVALISALKQLRLEKSFDPFLIAILSIWIAYLAQSIISINNIGLGIWGWVLPGLIISREAWHKTEILNSRNARTKNRKSLDFSSLFLTIGMVVGGTVGFIPFNADASFRHALESANPQSIYSIANKWPEDTSRLLYAVQVFDNNEIYDKATQLARKTTEINPRSYNAWFYLYGSPSVTGNEKREILDRLKALDPHNPDLKKLG